MKNQNPAQQAQDPKITFMEKVLEDFADFVVESMAEGHHEDFEDYFEFLKAALETYIDEQEELNS